MSKTLIIAEKPSVANDIAKTLGGFTKHDEYFESDEYVLSSAVGHLLEIAVPEEYDVKRGKWTFTHLPMIPPHFALNPIAKTESRLKVLHRLIKRKDVSTLINACDAGVYEGRWLDTKHKKDDSDPEKRAERLWSKAAAESIVAACRGKQGNVSEESKPTTSMAPALFDLTSLQREANSRFGFSAKNTLGLAQALYEKHKVLTYPRTDSRHLPEDYINTVKDTMVSLAENHNYHQFAKQITDKGWVKPNKRIFDNTKISDHFAIIPTTIAPKNLSEPEQNL